MFRETLAKVVFSLVLLAAPTVSAAEDEATENAAAQDAEAEGAWVPKMQGNRLGGELDWWPDTGKDTFTWGIVGQIRVARAVHIDFEVPMGYRDVGANKNFIFGNPTVGAHWADSVSSRVGFFAGAALAVSTFIRNDQSSNPFESGIVEQYRPRSAAFESRAYADGQRFLPDSLFLRARFGLEARIIPEFFYRVEIAPMGVIPLGMSDGGMLVDVVNEFEGRGRSGFGGGLHLQAVGVALGDRDRNIFPGLEPYFTYEPLRGAYARFGTLVTFNTNPAQGDVIEGPFSWPTIRIAAGGKW